MGYKKTDKCIEKAYDDERLFVLMARDPQAPEVIIKWIAHSLGNQPDAKIREALECAIEMQNTGHIFRERKEREEKDNAAIKEREEFEAWKKRQAQGERLVDAGLAMRKPTKFDGESGAIIGEKGREVYGIDFTKDAVKGFEIVLGRSFASWLDSLGNGAKIEKAKATAHGFAMLLDEFLKSVPNR
jgi:hypothetical protein